MSHLISIVDSHKLFSEGLSSLLSNNEEYDLVNFYSTGSQYINRISSIDCEILLIDSDLPDMSIIEFINTVREKDKKIKLVILVHSENSSTIINLYDLDINGIVSKSSSFENFILSLGSISNDEKFYDASILPLINKELLNRDIKEDILNRITKREKQILICVAKDMSNKEIAADCHISERTVKNHLSSIFQKIEVSDRTQAAVFAIKSNMVQV